MDEAERQDVPLCIPRITCTYMAGILGLLAAKLHVLPPSSWGCKGDRWEAICGCSSEASPEQGAGLCTCWGLTGASAANVYPPAGRGRGGEEGAMLLVDELWEEGVWLLGLYLCPSFTWQGPETGCVESMLIVALFLSS